MDKPPDLTDESNSEDEVETDKKEDQNIEHTNENLEEPTNEKKHQQWIFNVYKSLNNTDQGLITDVSLNEVILKSNKGCYLTKWDDGYISQNLRVRSTWECKR